MVSFSSMKKYLILSLLFLAFASSVGLIALELTDRRTKKPIYCLLKQVDLRNLHRTEEDLSCWLSSGKGLIVFINPDCDHCQYQVEALAKNVNRPFDLRIAFLSGAPVEKLKAFSVPYREIPGIRFVQDPGGQLADLLKVGHYPTLFLFARDGQLITRLNSEAKPSFIYKHWENEN